MQQDRIPQLRQTRALRGNRLGAPSGENLGSVEQILQESSHSITGAQTWPNWKEKSQRSETPDG